MRVLVIDDSKPVRGILAKLFDELGCETIQAANGQQALERLRELGVPQLATVNWNMPIMDGVEFIRNVRSDRRLAKLPLLVISGESAQATIDCALSAGASDFLVKPVTRKMLAEKLVQLGLRPAPDAGAPQPTNAGTEQAGTEQASTEQAGTEQASTEQAGTTQAAATQAGTTNAITTITPTQAGPIRVLIVDDSVVVRHVLSAVLKEDPDLAVVGAAADGQAALNQLASARPDVVLLDIEMPVMDGFDTLRALRKSHPRLPVIMFSSLTERGAAATLEALFLGASDYVSKPGGTGMQDIEAGKRTIAEQVIPKIKQFARPVGRTRPIADAAIAANAARREEAGWRRRINVLAMAVSTGGPQALAQLLPAFVPNCPVPVLIVQHMPPMFTRHLARRLSSEFGLPACEAEEGREPQPGHVYVAPGGRHMRVEQVDGRMRICLNDDPAENGCRPSADVLFRSVAAAYGSAALTVVLTGMGQDGMRGCRQLRDAGGRILVQDQQSSVVWGMPGQVVRAGLADQILPLDKIGAEITRCLRRHRDGGGE